MWLVNGENMKKSRAAKSMYQRKKTVISGLSPIHVAAFSMIKCAKQPICRGSVDHAVFVCGFSLV